jgi:type I restriction enzyme S subunit
VKNVKAEGIDFDEVKYISKEQYMELTIGIAKEIRKELPFGIFVSLALLKPKRELIDSSYLEFVLNSKSVRQQFIRRLKGIGVKDLHLEEIRQVKIPLPPLKTQRKIAFVLQKANSLKQKRKEANQISNGIPQSLFLQMFGDSLTVSESWQWFTIEECMDTIIDYRGKTPPKTPSGIPLITAKIVGDAKLMEPNEFIAPDFYDKWMVRGFPKYGDILFTTEAPLGKVAQLKINGRVALAQRIILLRGKENIVDNKFLLYALLSAKVRQDIVSRATGSTVKGVRQSEFRKVKIPTPPIALQRKFAQIVEKVESLHVRQYQSAQEIDHILDSLMSNAFKGEFPSQNN